MRSQFALPLFLAGVFFLTLANSCLAYEHIPILLTVNDCDLVKHKTSAQIIESISTSITKGSTVAVSQKLRVDVFDCLALVRGKIVVAPNAKRDVKSVQESMQGHLVQARRILQRNANAVTQMKMDSLSNVPHKNRTTNSTLSALGITPTIVMLNHNARIETQRLKAGSGFGSADLVNSMNDTERFGNVIPTSVPSHLDVISTASNDGIFAIPTAYQTHEPALVYIVGTGIRTSHYEFTRPDSSSRATTIYNAFPLLPAYCEDHETCIASIAAGRTVGVNPNSLVFGARVLDCDGGGWLSDVVAATYAIGDHCAQYNLQKTVVINYSLGGETTAVSDVDAMADAFNNVRRRCGAMIFAAAGNEARDASNFVPAALVQPSQGKVMSVAACSTSGNWASFSNFGPSVTIIAPGVNVYCASASGFSAYTAVSGTSPATPIATGIASLHAGEMPSGFYAATLRRHKKRGTDIRLQEAVLYTDAIRLRMFDDAKDGIVRNVPPNTVNRFSFIDHAVALGTGSQYITVPPSNGNLNNIIDTPDPPALYLTNSAESESYKALGYMALVFPLLSILVVQFVLF